MQKILSIGIISFLLFSCLSFDFTDFKVQKTKIDDLENPGELYTLVVFYRSALTGSDMIIIRKYVLDNGTIFYTLSIDYSGENWRFMSGDVKIKTDKKLYKFKDKKVLQNATTLGVTETISVTVKKDVLSDMANSSEIRIQYWGEPLTLPEKSVENIKRFYEEYVSNTNNNS